MELMLLLGHSPTCIYLEVCPIERCEADVRAWLAGGGGQDKHPRGHTEPTSLLSLLRLIYPEDLKTAEQIQSQQGKASRGTKVTSSFSCDAFRMCSGGLQNTPWMQPELSSGHVRMNGPELSGLEASSGPDRGSVQATSGCWDGVWRRLD